MRCFCLTIRVRVGVDATFGGEILRVALVALVADCRLGLGLTLGLGLGLGSGLGVGSEEEARKSELRGSQSAEWVKVRVRTIL